MKKLLLEYSIQTNKRNNNISSSSISKEKKRQQLREPFPRIIVTPMLTNVLLLCFRLWLIQHLLSKEYCATMNFISFSLCVNKVWSTCFNQHESILLIYLWCTIFNRPKMMYWYNIFNTVINENFELIIIYTHFFFSFSHWISGSGVFDQITVIVFSLYFLIKRLLYNSNIFVILDHSISKILVIWFKLFVQLSFKIKL